MFDGVVLNDPFGGWVQWNRVVPIDIETVEVVRGGASSLYGDSSLSGAVNVRPREIENKYLLSADVFGGSQKTLSGAAFAGFKTAGWTGDLAASNFQTKGYKPVDEAVRGPADVFAGVRSSSVSPKVTREFGKRASIFFRPSYFGEVRTNGTGLQTNRTHIRQAITGGYLKLDPDSNVKIDWRIYGGTQVFDQISSTVNTARTSETISRVQRVPVQSVGASVQISGVYRHQTFLGGVETRNVRGSSDEIGFTNGVSSSLAGSGGRQNTTGVFFQDFAQMGKRLVISGSVRLDRWRNYGALTTTRTLSTNVQTTIKFTDRNEQAVSPQISMLFHVSEQFSVYANASRSFRAPTLNELYRSFRVGNVLTQANENLLAEHAKNVEGGVSFARKRSFVRAGGFWAEVDNPVSNVTLSSTASLITRQRQNAGSTRSSGIELEAETSFREFTFSAGYMFVNPIVSSFPNNRALEGLLIPQIARNQFTFQGRYGWGKWTAAMQGRSSSGQFDDDQNLFRLEPYTQIDLFFSRRLTEKLQIYAAVENVFNSRYSVAKTPIRSVSSSVNFRVGFRWN